MYSDLIGAAKDKYNMEMLFTDFLCYRQPAMEQYQDVPDGEEGGHMWLGGQAKAAEAHGVEVQWCMALAHQMLESVRVASRSPSPQRGSIRFRPLICTYSSSCR